MTGKQIAAQIKKLPNWNQWGNLSLAVERLEKTWAWNDGLDMTRTLKHIKEAEIKGTEVPSE